jgi:hypothetical protein
MQVQWASLVNGISASEYSKASVLYGCVLYLPVLIRRSKLLVHYSADFDPRPRSFPADWRSERPGTHCGVHNAPVFYNNFPLSMQIVPLLSRTDLYGVSFAALVLDGNKTGISRGAS